MRLNKYIAHAGICSRRKADEFIKAGLVKVNDEVVREMGYKVQEKDLVKFKDQIVRLVKDLVYVLLNKPKNFITTTSDERNRHTVMELVTHATDQRIYPVGRLDRNTTGLLLLTNDGDLAQRLSHPSGEVSKLYRVTLDVDLRQKDFDAIKKGLVLEDGLALVDELSYIIGEEKSDIGIKIHIGRNRIVRRIFESLGYEVKKLDRVIYAGLTKKKLPRGKWRHLTQTEIINLKHLKSN